MANPVSKIFSWKKYIYWSNCNLQWMISLECSVNVFFSYPSWFHQYGVKYDTLIIYQLSYVSSSTYATLGNQNYGYSYRLLHIWTCFPHPFPSSSRELGGLKVEIFSQITILPWIQISFIGLLFASDSSSCSSRLFSLPIISYHDFYI